MARRAGRRPARGHAVALPPIPPIPQVQSPIVRARGGRARGGGRGRAGAGVAPMVVQPIPGVALLPPIVQQVIQPPGPLPPNFPAVAPPLPGNPIGDFEHVLEFIVGLDTQQRRDCVTIIAGCVTCEYLLYVETENLSSCRHTGHSKDLLEDVEEMERGKVRYQWFCGCGGLYYRYL
jgi:hypothetical protein